MIDRDFVDINKYMDTRTLISSRGCIGTCKFCTTPYYFKMWNGRTAEDVVSEIEMLISKYNAKKIMFLDDNSTVDKNRMINVLEKYCSYMPYKVLVYDKGCKEEEKKVNEIYHFVRADVERK